jgi:hypothetical protein
VLVTHRRCTEHCRWGCHPILPAHSGHAPVIDGVAPVELTFEPSRTRTCWHRVEILACQFTLAQRREADLLPQGPTLISLSSALLSRRQPHQTRGYGLLRSGR